MFLEMLDYHPDSILYLLDYAIPVSADIGHFGEICNVIQVLTCLPYFAGYAILIRAGLACLLPYVVPVTSPKESEMTQFIEICTSLPDLAGQVIQVCGNVGRSGISNVVQVG